jgi:16S rRNA C1402 (ribose-2'-O) methylase RsmI
MTSITKTAENNIDEFGRDLSLKPEKQVTSTFSDYFARFKGMSWNEIGWLIEDEEEEERKKEEEERRKKQEKVMQAEREELCKALSERKQLHEKGLYELEEGEEIEM